VNRTTSGNGHFKLGEIGGLNGGGNELAREVHQGGMGTKGNRGPLRSRKSPHKSLGAARENQQRGEKRNGTPGERKDAKLGKGEKGSDGRKVGGPGYSTPKHTREKTQKKEGRGSKKTGGRRVMRAIKSKGFVGLGWF